MDELLDVVDRLLAVHGGVSDGFHGQDERVAARKRRLVRRTVAVLVLVGLILVQKRDGGCDVVV